METFGAEQADSEPDGPEQPRGAALDEEQQDQFQQRTTAEPTTEPVDIVNGLEAEGFTRDLDDHPCLEQAKQTQPNGQRGEIKG